MAGVLGILVAQSMDSCILQFEQAHYIFSV
jgi:hypothetical protein